MLEKTHWQAGYSSVGRASDCRALQLSDGPWFDSGWPDFSCVDLIQLLRTTHDRSTMPELSSEMRLVDLKLLTSGAMLHAQSTMPAAIIMNCCNSCMITDTVWTGNPLGSARRGCIAIAQSDWGPLSGVEAGFKLVLHAASAAAATFSKVASKAKAST